VKTPEMKQNVKLGAFVLGGLLIFLLSVFFIGKESNVFSPTFEISAVFKNVEGLQKGDNVWLSGVKIGTVKSVDIVREGKVVVRLRLRDKQNQFIRKNATASIGSDGFIGNKIVVIRPGNAHEIIEDSDVINADSPADTQELLNIAKDVGENTKSLTKDLRTIISKINKGQGIVGELLNDGPLANDIRATIGRLKATGDNTEKASAQLTGLLTDMRHGDGLLPTLISDTTLTRTFEDAIGNVKKVSQQAAQVANNLQQVTAKMNDNNNALGVLMADTAFAHKLQRTMTNAESASKKLDQDMEALKHNFLLRGYFRKQAKKEKENEKK
jgi:phospholipid/cholesterol/gamma-HCH transport system substrate-binding protein